VAERYIETELRHFDTGGPRRGRAAWKSPPLPHSPGFRMAARAQAPIRRRSCKKPRIRSSALVQGKRGCVRSNAWIWLFSSLHYHHRPWPRRCGV